MNWLAWAYILALIVFVAALIVWTGIKDRGSGEAPSTPPIPITESVETASTTDEIITHATNRIIAHLSNTPPLIPFAGCQEWSVLGEVPPDLGYPGTYFVEVLFPVCDGVVGERYDKPIAAYITDVKLVTDSHLRLRKLICDAVDTSVVLVAAGFTDDICRLVYEEFLQTFGGFPPQGVSNGS